MHCTGEHTRRPPLGWDNREGHRISARMANKGSPDPLIQLSWGGERGLIEYFKIGMAPSPGGGL